MLSLPCSSEPEPGTRLYEAREALSLILIQRFVHLTQGHGYRRLQRSQISLVAGEHVIYARGIELLFAERGTNLRSSFAQVRSNLPSGPD
jgi:ABC-type uncharacterized transport system YnjBCD permease subunit